MKNPIKDEKDSRRVYRGGCWDDYPEDVRSSSRDDDAPTSQYYYLGFRLVKNVPQEKK